MQDLNDKITDSSLTATEWNQLPSEVQNLIESTGQTLSSGDVQQAVKSVSTYSTVGDFYTGAGSVNAYTATVVSPRVAPDTLVDGMGIRWVAPSTNTTASTLNAFGSGVVNIRLVGGVTAIAAGDIVIGQEVETVYRTSPSAHWEITNPRVSGGIVLTDKIQPITASVAANALTLKLNATTLDFRSSTLTSGTVNTRTIASPISLVISSGSTLGTVSAVQSRIAVIAIDNNGTIELAAVNLAGGTLLDETGLISTTAEGGAGAADSATVIYSTTARSSVAYRVVGYVESTQATAGTWATAPSTIQGTGGLIFTSISSLGYWQKWQDVTASRAINTNYTNTTGRPIQVCIFVNGAGVNPSITIDGIVAAKGFDSTAACFVTAIVQSGSVYQLTNSDATNLYWTELR